MEVCYLLQQKKTQQKINLTCLHTVRIMSPKCPKDTVWFCLAVASLQVWQDPVARKLTLHSLESHMDAAPGLEAIVDILAKEWCVETN